MKACILVGGKGTRLGSLTKNTPKPLLEVAGKPFVRYVIENLLKYDIKDIILASGYLHEEFLKMTDILSQGCQSFSIIKEEAPLGTGGAIVNCQEALSQDENFLVLNGDTFFEFDLSTILKTYSKPHHSMILREVEDVSRYGRVTIHKNIVTEYNEKKYTGRGLINSGFYIFNGSIFKYIEADKVVSLEEDILPLLVSEGSLEGIKMSGYFIDMGLQNTYEQAQIDFSKRK